MRILIANDDGYLAEFAERARQEAWEEIAGVIEARLAQEWPEIEIDEAYGVALSALLTPRTVLLLNIQIDQLNRFHEPDRVVGMLERIAATAT